MNADPDILLADGSPSPGEMRKLILALGLHQGPLLMLLDEPTNYLDHQSPEALARVLADYRGPWSLPPTTAGS